MTAGGGAAGLFGGIRGYRADLHIHTCLSPCAELDMTPLRIIKRAKELGLDIIAITDHNSAENAVAAQEVGRNTGITVLAGIEVTSIEEAHVLALFESAKDALSMQQRVYAGLGGSVDTDKVWQVVVNERDEVTAMNGRLLIGATDMTLKILINEIHARGGLAVASHVDREVFSVSSQMGFVPDDLIFDAFEVVSQKAADQALIFHPASTRLSFSDAHHIADIGRKTTVFNIANPALSEIALALRRQDGRSIAG